MLESNERPISAIREPPRILHPRSRLRTFDRPATFRPQPRLKRGHCSHSAIRDERRQTVAYLPLVKKISQLRRGLRKRGIFLVAQEIRFPRRQANVTLKWSRKFGQVAKVYPDDEEGMRSYGKAPEFYRSIQGEGRA